jgi:hypothetical protein
MRNLGPALLLVALTVWPATVLAVEPATAVRAPPATADWPKALKDWNARAELGDNAAPKQLCELYFDGRGGAFDAAATIAWCRRAAEHGDAAAMQRLGLLSLAGVGVGKDLDAAAKLCAQASPYDPAVSGAFCLAAVAEERQRSGLPALAVTIPAALEAEAISAATVSQWRDQAARGGRDATMRLCEFYFGARGGAFVPRMAADWCRRAARNGDAAALRRLGLMRLWGVGMDKSASQAEALCSEAQARDPTVSALFCVAAIKEERALAAAAAAPSHFAHVGPQSGSLPLADVAGQDRAIASVRATATGLQFTCRDMLKWSRYEASDGLGVLTAETRAFGRPLLEYQEQDYAALDRGAAECAAAIAPYDRYGDDRPNLAEFRKMLPLIKARQHELGQQRQARRGDVQRCVEALRRSRAVAQQLVPVTGPIDSRSADAFSCTSAGSSQPVTADIPSAVQPQRPAEAVR